MSRPTVYATHDALEPPENVPGSPWEYVLRLSHDIEVQAARDYVRRVLKLSGKRDARIADLERDLRRLVRALKEVDRLARSKPGIRPVGVPPVKPAHKIKRLGEIAGRALIRHRKENPE